MTTDEQNFVLKARRDKHDALIERGIAPYAYRFARTHTAAAAIAALGDADAGETVSVAGRIVAWRAQGKTIFAHFADGSGRIQLYFRKDELGDALFETLKLFDLGDVIGVTGALFRTKTGEATVRVASAEMLAKSLRPLPFGKEETVDGVRRAPLGVQRSRAALPPARGGSRGAPRRARGIRRALEDDQRAARLSRRARLSRGRDAGAAAAVRRRRGAPVHDAPQRARHTVVSCASPTSSISSGSSSAASMRCTRSATTSATKASTARTTPSSRCSSGIRRTRTTPT